MLLEDFIISFNLHNNPLGEDCYYSYFSEPRKIMHKNQGNIKYQIISDRTGSRTQAVHFKI